MTTLTCTGDMAAERTALPAPVYRAAARHATVGDVTTTGRTSRAPGQPRLVTAAVLVGAVVVLGAGVVGLGDLPRSSTAPTPFSASTSASPTASASASAANPARARYPDATSTGVPAGTVLKPSGPLRVTANGTVVEGFDVTGEITVEADHVTIRDVRIRGTGGPLVVLHGTGLVVEDSELDGRGGGVPAIGFHDYTLRRVDIHDVAEGPRISGDNVTIEDSYVHNLVQVGANHTDAVQVVGGSGIVVRGNTLRVDNPASGSLGNAAFQFGEEEAPVRDCLVEGNFLDGGNYTVNGGGGGTHGSECTFRGNVVGPHSRYGPAAHLGPGVVWESTNVDAAGRPIILQRPGG
jgi:hypothetical protein